MGVSGSARAIFSSVAEVNPRLREVKAAADDIFFQIDGGSAILDLGSSLNAKFYDDLEVAGDLTVSGTQIAIGYTDIRSNYWQLFETVNDGNPYWQLGSSTTNDFYINTVYNSGAQTLDYVRFQSRSSVSGDGEFRFYPKEPLALTLETDGDLVVEGELTVKEDFIHSDSNWPLIGTNVGSNETEIYCWYVEADKTADCTVATSVSVHRLHYDDLVSSSSMTKKENIANLDERFISEQLRGLQAKEYNLVYDKKERKVGLIAEEVPEMVQTQDKKAMTLQV